MNEELKKEIIDILDNVSYWETCPEDYKPRIEAIKQQLIIDGVVGQSEQLKAVEKLKDFAYEVCPLHREDDLEEIVGSL
jgi:hypothetical protein